MKKIIQIILIGFLLNFLLNSFALAQSIKEAQSVFNAKEALKQLDKKPDNQKLPELILHFEKLKTLREHAEVCVEHSNKQLKVINDLLKEVKADPALKIPRSDFKFFRDKKLFYGKQRSACRIFIYRSKAVIDDYKESIQKLSAFRLLKRSTPIWKAPEKEALLSIKNISGQKIYAESGIGKISLTQFFIGLFFLVVAALIGLYVRILCRRWLVKSHTGKKVSSAFIAVTYSLIIPIIIFVVLSVFLSVIFTEIANGYTLSLISYLILAFLFLFALSKYFLYPSKKVASPIGLKKNLGKSFHYRTITVLSWLFLSYVAILIFGNQNLSNEIIDLSRTLFVVILSVLTVWLCWLFPRIPKVNRFSAFALSLKVILSILLLATVVTELLGYHRLAIFIITRVILTIVFLVVLTALFYFIGILYRWIDDNKYYSARTIRKIFGVKPHRKLNEIILVEIAAYVSLFCFAGILFMNIWNFPIKIIDAVEKGLLSGFTIFDVKVSPLRIISSFVIFALIMLTGRFIAATILRRSQFSGEGETQLAISSILVYISFAVALIFSLLFMGVSFTGLTIVAGALSVGVGLGLQTIVNNFVCGLILLLEKPVKPGDRVVVEGTEGFIKKIRIRSTQIATLAKEDVIVPNSDLITKQVTNYMFRDQLWRVVCSVGVIYGSDTELVKKVLSDVASQHSGIVQEKPNAPLILFREFGDSSLKFELWCVIHNVNKKYVIASDLNFLINKAFKKHKITIAFPQRDIHIKDYPLTKETPTTVQE